jgi:hypothetical protein
MNRITRLLALTGIGLAAGISIGAGPAQAASAAGADSSSRTTAAAKADWNDDETVGYFSSRIRCERAGRIGEIRDRWEDYDCNRVRFGFHRGDYALEVQYDRWDNDRWGNHDRWGNDHRGFRPGFPGRPIRGGFGHGPRR